MDQRELVVRAQRGDQDAFALLAGAAVARLDAAARLILRDAELARDAVQEAMVRAWRDLPGLRDPDRFDAWLHRLTVHACIDVARRRRRRVIEVELTPDPMPSVADSSAGRRRSRPARRALRRLDAGAARRHRPSLLPGAVAARRRRRARHPARDRQVPAPPLARWRCAATLADDGRDDRAGPGRAVRMTRPNASNAACRCSSTTSPPRARPTTSTTSSARSPARGSGPPGPSPKGGSPCLLSPIAWQPCRASDAYRHRGPVLIVRPVVGLAPVRG